jgi:hypothetical protein
MFDNHRIIDSHLDQAERARLVKSVCWLLGTSVHKKDGAVKCRDANSVQIRRPRSGSLSSSEAQPLSRPLVHGTMIRPAIEVGWLDILLAQQSGYLRTMIDGVVDGLDQHDDGRSLIAPPVKMEDLTQFPLLRA